MDIKLCFVPDCKGNALNAIENLRNKTAEIWSRPNNPELEMDFRTTCSEYQKNSSLNDPQLTQAYKDYINSYQQKTSLYNIIWEMNNTKLFIYNTETNTKEVKILKIPQELDFRTCITQLPNGKLFCYGKKYRYPGIILIIDVNGGVKWLPSGTPCTFSSSIYFNNSVYCFGGKKNNGPLNLSSRFDLEQNRWIQLASMPKAGDSCNSTIFNGNILISGYENRNIWLYSIDIDSFSTIPYQFATGKTKILINAKRLYLIEYGDDGSIYECEIGSYMNWRWIAESTFDFRPKEVYCSYNKGGIYIGTLYSSEDIWDEITYECYKFDLKEKVISKLLSISNYFSYSFIIKLNAKSPYHCNLFCEKC